MVAHAGEADWNLDKQKLYEFIVRSFLACCSLDAVGYETAVTAEIAGVNGYSLNADCFEC